MISKIKGLFLFSLFVPRERIVVIMKRSVFACFQDNKIINSIVKFISVYVMNMIFFFKRSPDMVFHYKTMFENNSTAYYKFFISLFVNSSLAISSLYKFKFSSIHEFPIMRMAKPSAKHGAFAILNLADSVFPCVLFCNNHNIIIRLLRGESKCV